MGILNVTPDSFSDGGRYLDATAAVRRVEELLGAGADILDIGGESTRPGAAPVSATEETARILPAVAEAVRLGATVSVDTSKAAVAEAALERGAHIINDVTALGDPAMGPLAAASGAGLVLMHMRGTPRTMQQAPVYADLCGEIAGFLETRRETAENQGVERDRIVLDPGVGFGKTVEHNLKILAGLESFLALGSPVLVGVSRKRFLGAVTGVEDPQKRTAGSLAAAVAARLRGASIFRVHDVAATGEALAVADAILARDH